MTLVKAVGERCVAQKNVAPSFLSYEDGLWWHLCALKTTVGSITFKLFVAINLYFVNCGHVASNWSARCATKFKNIGRNVVVASKSGPVETGSTVLVAMAL